MDLDTQAKIQIQGEPHIFSTYPNAAQLIHNSCPLRPKRREDLSALTLGYCRFFSTRSMPSAPPSRHQWPRGPPNDFHHAANKGSVDLILALLWQSSIDVNQGDHQGATPLMIAAYRGYSRTVTILLEQGANVSVVSDGDLTALHASSQQGHLATTKMLVQAGAGLEAVDSKGYTPLHLAAERGHWEIMSVLIGAGANPDTRLTDGQTPLFTAACNGHLVAIRVLLSAGADPLLSKRISPQDMPIPLPSGQRSCPLDIAAQEGHSGVVHELVQQRGIEGCGGTSRGVQAYSLAAQVQHVDVMNLLTAAGVANTGKALLDAVECGGEDCVKFLLQQQQKRNAVGVSRYVNYSDNIGATPLFRSVWFASCSPRVVRLLIDAGADAPLAVEVRDTMGLVAFKGTPLALAIGILFQKKVQGKDATEEQLNRLEAIRRLLMRVDAVHAVSWL